MRRCCRKLVAAVGQIAVRLRSCWTAGQQVGMWQWEASSCRPVSGGRYCRRLRQQTGQMWNRIRLLIVAQHRRSCLTGQLLAGMPKWVVSNCRLASHTGQEKNRSQIVGQLRSCWTIAGQLVGRWPSVVGKCRPVSAGHCCRKMKMPGQKNHSRMRTIVGQLRCSWTRTAGLVGRKFRSASGHRKLVISGQTQRSHSWMMLGQTAGRSFVRIAVQRRNQTTVAVRHHNCWTEWSELVGRRFRWVSELTMTGQMLHNQPIAALVQLHKMLAAVSG